MYLFVTLLYNLVAGVAPDSQMLSVVLNNQLRDLRGLMSHYYKNSIEYVVHRYET